MRCLPPFAFASSALALAPFALMIGGRSATIAGPMRITLPLLIALIALAACPALAQVKPYDAAPPAEAPYYRVRYEASDKPGELIYPVQYTVWLPPGVKELRGV